MTIGMPPQNIVMLPWPDLNNTWIFNQNAFCNPLFIWDDVICRVRHGNYYLEDNSSTWAKEGDIIVAGGAATETQADGEEAGVGDLIATGLGGTEELGLEKARNLANFPVGIPGRGWDNGYTMLHVMGMGANSTILNALLNAGQISSRVWSIFWGRTWVDDDNAIDGSVVFGGYDQQKTTGRNYTQPLDFSEKTGCWTGMKVHISGLTVHPRSGGDFNLLSPNEEFAACIVPQRQLLLEGPQDIINEFEKKTDMQNYGQSAGLHNTAFVYHASDVKSTLRGDLTISLSMGLDIRIPSDQYLIPWVDIDRNGSRYTVPSKQELLIGAVTNQPATLGRYFFTAAYLMVDLDANEFTLWQANPTSDSRLHSRITKDF
ncbi:hypothetical protein ABKA04_004100 [Annulohypoxylon sp. FPYF3050]